MSSFRRWYFYVVSAISLQAVTWAVIALLRNLLAPSVALADPNLAADVQTIAFQISVIIIGLPMFLLHWHWTGREAGGGSAGNSAAVERFLYLYVMCGAFLIPLLTNANGLLQSLLRLASGTPAVRPFLSDSLPDRANLLYTGTAVLILTLMLLYHARLLRQDRRAYPKTDTTASLHRLFIYLFSAAGLAVTSFAAAALLQWLILAIGDRTGPAVSRQLIDAIAAIITGLLLWLYFWRQAQTLFRSGSPAEENSLLRKLYLYLTIFLSVLATVGALTAILASFLRRLLNLDPQSGSGLVLSSLIVGAVVWAYHALVLREDTRRAPLAQVQAGLRRLYRYLVAAVGLLVLLTGLSGVLGVLFQPGDFIVSQQREQLAWFAAMLISGLIVWLVPWRNIQAETAEPAPGSISARTSVVRRFYLFFFLLLATLTFLIAAVYILSRLLLVLLGEPLSPLDLRTMALSAAYAIMAGIVWLYHGRLLRADGAALEALQDKRAAAIRIVVVDDGDGKLGRPLLDSLRSALPHSDITPVGLSASAAAHMRASPEINVDQAIAAADIIVGPWSMAASHAGLNTDESIQAAIAASPARKFILPRPSPTWEWAMSARWQPQMAVREATETIERIVAGETASLRHLTGPAMIIFLVVATIIVLMLIASLLGSVIPIF